MILAIEHGSLTVEELEAVDKAHHLAIVSARLGRTWMEFSYYRHEDHINLPQ